MISYRNKHNLICLSHGNLKREHLNLYLRNISFLENLRQGADPFHLCFPNEETVVGAR